MTKRERFLAGEVFNLLQQPHFYRFCDIEKALYRNINNSMVDFENYANVVRTGKNDFDAIVQFNPTNSSNIFGHHWLYDELHFGWGKGLTGKLGFHN